VQAAIALLGTAALGTAALGTVPAEIAIPAKAIPTLTALSELALAVVALGTAMLNAVVPVQRLLAAWAASVGFVVSRAAALVAFRAASVGSKVG